MEDKLDGEQVERSSVEHVDDVSAWIPATAKEEAAVIRKLDLRLLPLVFVLYSFSVLDRSNLGNAKLAGLQDAVDLSGTNYNWLGTLFYIACEQSSIFAAE